MVSFPEAEKRLFDGVWICMSCGAKMRAPIGKKPEKCRKCHRKNSLRLKHKRKK